MHFAGSRKNVNLIRRQGWKSLLHLHENLIKHTQLSKLQAGKAQIEVQRVCYRPQQ